MLPEEIVGAFLTYWYYYLPDYALALLMYTVLGRAALSLFLDADSENYIWRFFCRVTDPVIAAVGVVTPKATAPVILWLFSFVWLFWLRLVLRIVYAVSGLLPVK
jgi:YggT family protein